jgi:hypothetical protein
MLLNEVAKRIAREKLCFCRLMLKCLIERIILGVNGFADAAVGISSHPGSTFLHPWWSDKLEYPVV